MKLLQRSHRGLPGRALATLAVAFALVCAALAGAPSPALAATGSGYDPVTAKVTVRLTANDGSAVRDQRSTFVLTPSDDESVAPAESTVVVTGAGEASFSLSYDRVGEHHYTLRQVAGTAEHWTYDARVYDVTAYCMWDEKADALFTRVIVNDAWGYKADAATFENSYQAPETPAAQADGPLPKTGDDTMRLVATFVVVGVALVVAGIALYRKCRKK